MEYNNINQKAFSNINNIKGVMGESVPNTFTRNISGSPANQIMDPTMNQNTGISPTPPPTDVETPIVPPYDLNNY